MKLKPNQLDKLKETPRQPKFDLHYWADFIELKCLFNPDGVFSKDDFLDCYNSNKDFRAKESTFEITDTDDDTEDEQHDLSDRAYRNDKEELFADDCFKMIESRMYLFKEYYPITLSENGRAVFIKNRLSWKNRCYTFLLFSSALNYFFVHKSVLTSCFEVFSLYILKKILPVKAEAHLFGSSNSILKVSRYKGHIWDKFNQLKKDLNEIILKIKKEDFSPNNVGDGGFDFIAWVPNGDNQSHLITFTGQAACTDEWCNKKYTSSSSALASIIPISVPPVNLAFIPFSVRRVDGSWHEAHEIGECVLLDRQRLINHFENDRKSYLSLPCDEIIIDLLKIKETPYN